MSLTKFVRFLISKEMWASGNCSSNVGDGVIDGVILSGLAGSVCIDSDVRRNPYTEGRANWPLTVLSRELCRRSGCYIGSAVAT